MGVLKRIEIRTDDTGGFAEVGVAPSSVAFPVAVTNGLTISNFGPSIQEVQAATLNGLTINGSVSINAPVPILSPIQVESASLDGITTYEFPSSNVAVYSIPTSASSFLLLAANTNRRQVIIFNDTTSDLLIKFGSALANNTDFSIRLPVQGQYNMVYPPYTGNIYGWNIKTSTAFNHVTEMS